MSDEYKKTAIANLSQRRPVQSDDQEPEVPQRSARRPRRDNLEVKPITDILALRDAPPPPLGYRYTMDGRLVPAEESELSIDDPKAQELFCEIIEVTGSLRAAADALGIVSLTKVKRYIDRNPDFFESVEAAADRHRQALYAHAIQRATVGYQKPVIGGKDKNEIVAYERVVSDSLLALLLKRHFVEFRETKAPPQVTVNTTNVNLPNVKKMTREERDQMRTLLQGSPAPTPDPNGIIDVDPNPDSTDN